MNPFKGPRRKIAVALAATAAVVATTGAAWAFISFNATATASASSATLGNVTITNVTIDPALLPGAGLSAVKFTAGNTNTFPVKLTAITRSGGIVADPSCQTQHLTGPLGLTPTSIDLTSQNILVPANTTAQEVTVPGALGLADAATAVCGVKFPVTVTAQQQAPTTAPAPTPTS